jgi:hypothetical protein
LAAVGSAEAVGAEGDGERFDENAVFRFIGVIQAMAQAFRSS